jgi:alpha-galactosidase
LARIVLIGAGSAQFGTDMLCDLFAARDELKESTIVLVDTNPEALDIMAGVARRLNEATGRPFAVEATTDRAETILDEMLEVHKDYLPQFGNAAHQS